MRTRTFNSKASEGCREVRRAFNSEMVLLDLNYPRETWNLSLSVIPEASRVFIIIGTLEPMNAPHKSISSNHMTETALILHKTVL